MTGEVLLGDAMSRNSFLGGIEVLSSFGRHMVVALYQGFLSHLKYTNAVLL